jgi:hypothetical protein
MWAWGLRYRNCYCYADFVQAAYTFSGVKKWGHLLLKRKLNRRVELNRRAELNKRAGLNRRF